MGDCKRRYPALIAILAIVAALSGPGYALPTIKQLLPNNETLKLTVNKSQLIKLNEPATRVSVVAPEIADVQIIDPQQILVTAKQVGETTLLVWTEDDKTRPIDVSVEWNTEQIQNRINELMPDDGIEVLSTENGVALNGAVHSIDRVEKAMDIAAAYAPSVLNLLETPGNHQVLLKVKVAEVARSFRDEKGINFRYLDNTAYGGSTMGNLMSGNLTGDGLDISDAVTLFFGFPNSNIDAFVRAMQEKGLLQILAEPNLIARSGEKASFLAGGEFPIPVVQAGANNSITIEYKEFGVKLDFSPLVTDVDQIQLDLTSEVSDLDFSHGLQLAGFVIPSIVTRRAHTIVKLGDGQTFAVAGLISKQKQLTRQKIPGVGDIPLLGGLFKAKQLEDKETELLIMVTPHLIAPLDQAEGAPMPSEIEYDAMTEDEYKAIDQQLRKALNSPEIESSELPPQAAAPRTKNANAGAGDVSMTSPSMTASPRVEIASSELPQLAKPIRSEDIRSAERNVVKAEEDRERPIRKRPHR
ncbi:MAG: hypothetical protein GC154_19730 [bacterium]|nr:hypothetical protein [bacterium]